MAGCAHCGACCAPCASSCGGFGGGGWSALGPGLWGGGGLAPGLDGEDGIHEDDGDGSFGGFHFHPWFSSRRKKDEDPSATTVDTRALVDPNHPGHREAITAISHVDPEQHSKLMGWLKEEVNQARQ